MLPHSAALSVDSCPFSSNGDVLAWEPARNHVNNTSPWLAVKGPHVIPDGKRLQDSVILSGNKYACGVGVPFDGADGAPSEEFASENPATSACEKSQLIHLCR